MTVTRLGITQDDKYHPGTDAGETTPLMHVAAIIPARYGSSRFPGKPLAKETGKFLIQHVCEQVGQARTIDRCIVATDDKRIAEAVRSFGGEVVMTRADHPSGTDRIAEVVEGMLGEPDDIVLNVQGDEPELDPANLDRLVDRIARDEHCSMATLAAPFGPDADPRDPNLVKVARNRAGEALYFSRSLIPYPRDGVDEKINPADWLLHLGVYAYRRAFLLQFAGLPQSPLEAVEKLEQLRALEHGHVIAVEVVETSAPGIDTPAEYQEFVRRWRARRPE